MSSNIAQSSSMLAMLATLVIVPAATVAVLHIAATPYLLPNRVSEFPNL